MFFLLGCTPNPDLPATDDDTGTPTTIPVTPEPPLTATVGMSGNDRMVLEKRFAVTLNRPGRITLGCTSPADPLEDHLLVGDDSGELRLYGLLPATRYDCVLTDPGDPDGDPLWTGSFETEPLPDGFPEFVITGDPALATIDDGYVLFSHWKIAADGHIHRLVAMDGSGRVRWYRYFEEAATGGIAATWLGDRMVLGGGGVAPSLQNLSGDVLFQVAPPLVPDPDDDVYHHEAQLTPEGVLSLQLVPDSDGVAVWNGFRIEVTDIETHAVVWSFDSAEARIAGLLPSGTVDEDDPYHANAVSWRNDDPLGTSVWVSLRAMESLMRIDRITGALSFFGPAWGDLRDVDGDPVAPEEWFWGQHAPQYDGDEILVYDNGGNRPGSEPRYSRVAKFRREAADRMTLLWDWSEPGWFEPNFGMASELPGGHVLVTTGHCPDCPGTGGRQDTGWILELDPVSGTVVWRFDFTTWNDSTYRSQAIDGCSLFANRRFCPELGAD